MPTAQTYQSEYTGPQIDERLGNAGNVSAAIAASGDLALVGGKLQLKDREYDAETPDGLGYVILREDATFASQVTATNTIYEIRYDFELDDDFTMPAGCVLNFVGGSITGEDTLTFQNTAIEGNAKITCNIAGTVRGQVHAEWFGMVANDQTFDNSPIVEKVCSAFPFVVIDGDDYYFSTPIDLSTNALRNLIVNANLHYITSGSSTFITISGEFDLSIFGTVFGPVANNTGGADRTIGIKLADVNNSHVFIDEVKFFYTNIQVYASNGGHGNAYNHYDFGILLSGNILLELLAEGAGWITSNRFNCRRMAWFGGQTTVETAILIHGDNAGFSDNVFEKLTIEGVSGSEPVKLYNVRKMSFLNVRNEGNNTNFFYTENVQEVRVKFNYGAATVRTKEGSVCGLIDETVRYAGYEPLANCISVPGGTEQKLLFNAVNPLKQQLVNYSPLFYRVVGFIVPATHRVFSFFCKDKFELTVVYYDSNLDSITRDGQYMPAGNVTYKNSASISDGYASNTSSLEQTVAFPAFPQGCSYIGFFFGMSAGTTACNISSPIFSVPTDLIDNIVKSMFTYGPFMAHDRYGTTSQRPTFAENYRQYLLGYEFFDTTLGKPIYAKSIASNGTPTWVDATGAAVS